MIFALGATVDGATTAHWLTDRLKPLGVEVTRVAQGVPIGGALDVLDDGTLGRRLARTAVRLSVLSRDSDLQRSAFGRALNPRGAALDDLMATRP